MAEQKLIDVIELLRQSQEETKAEIITSRHSIQVMNTEIVESLRILANNVETNEDREERMRREAAAAGGQVDKETKVEPEGGFLGFLLAALGLTGAALAGLAAGFAEGFIKTYTAIFKDFTKLVRGSFNLLLKPFTAFTDFIKKPFIEGGSIRKLFSEAIDKLKPQFIDDIVKAFGEGGRVRVLFTTAIDSLKPSFIDDIVKAFSEGGRVRVLFTTAIDNLKPQFIDDIVKAFGESGSIGQIFTKIKTFFIGETSIFKTVGTSLDDAVKALTGFTPKIFTGIKNFFMGSEVFKNITTSFDEAKAVMPSAKDVSTGFIGKMTGAIKSVFGGLGALALKLFPDLNQITGLFGDVAKGGGLVKTILGDLLEPVGKFFGKFKTLAKFIAAPLIPIMAALDAFFEGKDAAEKSEGTLATIVNSVIGAIGGLIDGAVFQLADLIKSAISSLASVLGMKKIEETLDSFSFSEIFNNILDGIYKFVNNIFNAPKETLSNIAEGASGLVSSGVEGVSNLASSAVEGAKERFSNFIDFIRPNKNAAKGAVIVNRPSYLPSSGVVVGETKTYTGRGAAYGGVRPGLVPLDGGPEAVIPLSGPQAQAFIEPVARAIAGQSLNQMAMDRVGMGTAVASAAPTIVDSSTNTQIFNETNIRKPSVDSPSVYGESTDRMMRNVA